jgi:hypothetical protein
MGSYTMGIALQGSRSTSSASTGKLLNIACTTPCIDQLQGVNLFTQLADEDDCVPKLRKKQYVTYRLSRPEWNKIRLLHEVLEVS